jgi:FkbM family methyltransferase
MAQRRRNPQTVFEKGWFRWLASHGMELIDLGHLEHVAEREADLVENLLVELLDRERNGDTSFAEALGFIEFCRQHLPESSAQIYQDLWVLYMTGGKRAGYFVEFGACDGVSISNTLLLERSFGWKGILAEPNPFWHNALARNRSAEVDHRCVYSCSGETLAMQCVTSEPELSRIDRIVPNDVHEKEGHRLESKVVSVPTVSLLDLLDSHSAPFRIDYMSVDTEGSELEILQAFDFTRYDIGLLTVEHAGETEKRDAIRTLMADAGYSLWHPIISRWDDWFFRSSPASEGA